MERSTHIKGLVVTGTAVLILSPDALLVRMIHCEIWTLLFWRCLLTGIMQSLFLAACYRGQFVQCFRNIGRTGLLSALVVTCGALLFVNSLKQTAAANTLIILAASPLFSSLFSWVFLREKIARRTRAAIVICFGGMLLIFSGSLSSGFLFGDLLALGATLMWGLNLVILRHGKAVNMVPASMLGNLMVVLVALVAGAHPLDVTTQDMFFLLLLGGLVLPVSFTMITFGPRYLPAPEVSLVLLLETVLGPVWVWLVLGEAPLATTLFAGLLIVGTMVTHTLLALRAQKVDASTSPV